jgi:hypothetical protein
LKNHLTSFLQVGKLANLAKLGKLDMYGKLKTGKTRKTTYFHYEFVYCLHIYTILLLEYNCEGVDK